MASLDQVLSSLDAELVTLDRAAPAGAKAPTGNPELAGPESRQPDPWDVNPEASTRDLGAELGAGLGYESD